MQEIEPPSVDGLTDGLLDLFAYLCRSTQNDVFQTVADLDLSVSQVRLLFVVDASPHEPALHELATGLELSMAATGRAADALVRAGLVGRQEDATDRRVKRITLTTAGRALVERLVTARREDIRRFAGSLSEPERTRLLDALTPILSRPGIRAHTNGSHC